MRIEDWRETRKKGKTSCDSIFLHVIEQPTNPISRHGNLAYDSYKSSLFELVQTYFWTNMDNQTQILKCWEHKTIQIIISKTVIQNVENCSFLYLISSTKKLENFTEKCQTSQKQKILLGIKVFSDYILCFLSYIMTHLQPRKV